MSKFIVRELQKMQSMKNIKKKQDPMKIKDTERVTDGPEISPGFKKELKRVRKEVKEGKYVSYKTIDDMDKDISV